MKKFDIKLAKAGKEVCTKDGELVKILYTERDSPHFPVIALINNKDVQFFSKEGKYYIDKDSELDLFLK